MKMAERSKSQQALCVRLKKHGILEIYGKKLKTNRFITS